MCEFIFVVVEMFFFFFYGNVKIATRIYDIIVVCRPSLTARKKGHTSTKRAEAVRLSCHSHASLKINFSRHSEFASWTRIWPYTTKRNQISIIVPNRKNPDFRISISNENVAKSPRNLNRYRRTERVTTIVVKQ